MYTYRYIFFIIIIYAGYRITARSGKTAAPPPPLPMIDVRANGRIKKKNRKKPWRGGRRKKKSNKKIKTPIIHHSRRPRRRCNTLTGNTDVLKTFFFFFCFKRIYMYTCKKPGPYRDSRFRDCRGEIHYRGGRLTPNSYAWTIQLPWKLLSRVRDSR